MEPSNEDLSRLCLRLSRSDRTAFGELYKQLHAPLLRYTIRLTGCEELSGDVVQEVFLKLWKVRADLRPGKSVKALLFAMAHNRACNALRSRRVRRTDAAPDPDALHDPLPAPDEVLEGEQLRTVLNGWIARLPERRRTALLLSRVDRLSHQEIAEVMGCKPATINTHIVLALRDLRRRAAHLEPARRAA